MNIIYKTKKYASHYSRNQQEHISMVWPCHEERGRVNDDGCNEVNFNDDERSMSIKAPSHGATCCMEHVAQHVAQHNVELNNSTPLPDVTIYQMESRCYGFDAKTTDSLSKCSHGLMCNLRFGLGYCFIINSMTALYCTFLNLYFNHELHYLQLNSMANTNAIIIYTNQLGPIYILSCSVPLCVCVCVCVCVCACVCVCVCLYPPFSTRRSDSNQILHACGLIRESFKPKTS